MKCYGCREACPLCFCDDCCLEAEGPEWVPGGYTPAAPFFHLTRMVHMVDSCTNCGQCTEVCPCEIPVAKVWSTVNNKIRDVYGYLLDLITGNQFHSLNTNQKITGNRVFTLFTSFLKINFRR